MTNKTMSATYVDGFVLVVPKAKVKEYKKMAQEGAEMWLKLGALDYKECMLDDATPEQVLLHFPKLAKAKPDETVWFSFITYKSKADRNRINKKIHKEMEALYGQYDPKKKEFQMPFDMKRMAMGGFKVMVSK